MATRNPPPGGGNADRLARVAAMVNDAVVLLNSAMDEIRAETEHGDHDDDRNAARPPDRDAEQSG